MYGEVEFSVFDHDFGTVGPPNDSHEWQRQSVLLIDWSSKFPKDHDERRSRGVKRCHIDASVSDKLDLVDVAHAITVPRLSREPVPTFGQANEKCRYSANAAAAAGTSLRVKGGATRCYRVWLLVFYKRLASLGLGLSKLRIGDVVRIVQEDGPPLYLQCVEHDSGYGNIYRVLRSRPAAVEDLDELVAGETWFLASSSVEVAVKKGYGEKLGTAAVDNRLTYRVRGEGGHWVARHAGRDTDLGRKLSATARALPEVNLSSPLGLLSVTADPTYDSNEALASARARAAQGPSILKILFGRKRPEPPARQFVHRVHLEIPEDSRKAAIAAARLLGWRKDAAGEGDSGEVVLVRPQTSGDLISDTRDELRRKLARYGAVLVAAETVLVSDRPI